MNQTSMNPNTTIPAAGPLAGLRILDLTSVAMGPYMMQTIGDLGAEVIKVEPPQGDITRHLAPGRHAGMSPLFLQLNRSKRSVVLDLKDPAGRDALLQMARGADALPPWPRLTMPGWKPRAASASANAHASGVLPVPPTVTFPTTTTGARTCCARSTPARNSKRRSATAPRNRSESGHRSAASSVTRGVYQAATTRSEKLTYRRLPK